MNDHESIVSSREQCDSAAVNSPSQSKAAYQSQRSSLSPKVELGVDSDGQRNDQHIIDYIEDLRYKLGIRQDSIQPSIEANSEQIVEEELKYQQMISSDVDSVQELYD